MKAQRRSVLWLTFTALLLAPIVSWSQLSSDLEEDWNGIWNANGTAFELGVHVADQQLTLEAIESLGFEWTSENGLVYDRQAVIEVKYEGVEAVVEITLIDSTHAVASLRSCLPEYMVVCVLAKPLQAHFTKVASR